MARFDYSGVTKTAQTLIDRLIVGGSVLTIINIMPVAPSGAVVYYELQARK